MVKHYTLRSLQLKTKLMAPTAFVGAACLATLVAWGAAALVERVSAQAVTSRLLAEGITYAQVRADGLQIHLSGTAPNEALRYRLINLVGAVVESSRIRDAMEIAPIKAIEAPRYSIEMLRNDDGIQLIGLLPQPEQVAQLTKTAQALSPQIALMEMIETANYPAPKGWDVALAYGIEALGLLPRSKISVAAEAVVITAIASSEAEKRSFESELAARKPATLAVSIEISAPRPVLTPFTLRFVKDAQGARFDACAADTEAAKAKILAAAGAAGADPRSDCTLGLGVPTPRWAEAIALGLGAVASLPSATLTFSDADVSLLAGDDVAQDDFDRVVGDLENGLPDVFSLKSTLEKAASAAPQGPAEFTAILAPETHQLELRGRLTDVMMRDAVESYAKAAFGTRKVRVGTRLDPDLPDGWPIRVLAGLQALAELDHGKLVVRADTVEISGVTGSQSGKVRISQILSGKLGQGKTFKVAVSYDKTLDPLADLPTPSECATAAAAVLSKQQISFTPGSADIDAAAAAVMDDLAKALKRCRGVKLEVAGYTDAQGSAEGNRALSQARAEQVIQALALRQMDVSGLRAKGYGAENPIADNATEAGREANRRIAFNLIARAAPVEPAKIAAAEAIAVQSSLEEGAGEASPEGPAAGPVAPATPDAAPEGTSLELAGSDRSVTGPDFSGDTSPSVAPKNMTTRPKARPKPKG